MFLGYNGQIYFGQMKIKFALINLLQKVSRNSRSFLVNIFAILIGITSTSFAETFEVTTSADEGAGSFRNALFQANNAQEDSEIVFKIPETDKNFPKTGGKLMIMITKPLPDINAEFPVKITGKNITLDGSESLSKFSGLTLKSSGHEISGFTIQNFGLHGIAVQGTDEKITEKISLHDLAIFENGTFDENGHIGDGIRFSVNVKNSEIFNNTIARNNGNGIFLQSLTTKIENNKIFGNKILGNEKAGIRVEGANNIFGVDLENRPAPNFIAENKLHGYLFSGNFATENQVSYDYIGTDNVLRDQGNRLDGIRIKLGANNNKIGPNLKIYHNDGGVVIMGEKSVANQILENDIIQNKSEGILIEKVKDNPVNPTNIFQNNILKNIGNGITLHGASPMILQNQIAKNENHGIELLVHDDGTPDVINLHDEVYSMPSIKQNIINENNLGGILATDTIFSNWENIEHENEFNEVRFDIKVEWLQILKIAKTHDNFSYLQAEVTACKEDGESCLGSELRENDGEYYLGPNKFFNPKNRETFFKVTHFIVKNGERQTYSPHQIKITGAAEKILTLNDRSRVEQVLYSSKINSNFHASASKELYLQNFAFNENHQNLNLSPNLFSLGEITQQQAGSDSFWLIIAVLLTIFTYHFWKVGQRVLLNREQVKIVKKRRKRRTKKA